MVDNDQTLDAIEEQLINDFKQIDNRLGNGASFYEILYLDDVSIKDELNLEMDNIECELNSISEKKQDVQPPLCISDFEIRSI